MYMYVCIYKPAILGAAIGDAAAKEQNLPRGEVRTT